MSYEAKLIADSISPAGVRLTTLQVTFPRFILAELSRHRMFSLSAASSRAVPVRKHIAQIEQDGPFLPEVFGSNGSGMQSPNHLENEAHLNAAATWVEAAAYAVVQARKLAEIGVHKQLANRLLEPFLWHTVVVTATDFDNFFHLRCHPDAQPEFQKIAGMMRDAMRTNTPTARLPIEWHLPYCTGDDAEDVRPDRTTDEAWGTLARISAARCARVSYLTHEGKRDTKADLALATKLLAAGHMSPFEHPATPIDSAAKYYGNFKGWMQYRKLIHGESDPLGTHHD